MTDENERGDRKNISHKTWRSVKGEEETWGGAGGDRKLIVSRFVVFTLRPSSNWVKAEG